MVKKLTNRCLDCHNLRTTKRPGMVRCRLNLLIEGIVEQDHPAVTLPTKCELYDYELSVKEQERMEADVSKWKEGI